MNIEYSEAVLESIKSSPTDWSSRYADAPLNSIKDLTTIYLQLTGAVALLTAFLLFLIFRKGISIGNTQTTNRVTAFFFTFNCVVIPVVIMIFLFKTVNGNEEVQSLPIIGEKFLPSYAISSFIALSVVILAMCFLGFIGAMSESKPVVEAYAFILFITTLVMFVSGLLLTLYSKVFKKFYTNNWGDLMVYLHKDFYTPEFMGCFGGKYRGGQASTSYFDLKCGTKDEIAYIWEG